MTAPKQFRESSGFKYRDRLEVGEVDSLLDQYSKVVLTEFTGFLTKNGYCDSDVFEEPTAIDRFLFPKLNK